MQISYDKEANAVAIWFKGIESEKTIDVTEDIFVDLGKDGKLACIEILHASEKLDSADLLNASVESTDNESMIMMKWIPCRPTTYGDGHQDPDSHYSKFKDAIRTAMYGTCISEDHSVKIEAEVHLVRKRCITGRNDLDNFLKGIIDALNEANCFQSEHQVDEIRIKRILVDRSEEEGVRIALIGLHDKELSANVIASATR